MKYNINDEQSAKDFNDILDDNPSIILSENNSIEIISEEYDGDTFTISKEYSDVLSKAKDLDNKHLIFGKNNVEGIVAVEVIDDREIIMFKKNGDIEKLPFVNWILTNRPINMTSTRLRGDNHFNFITLFEDTDSIYAAKKKLRSRNIPYWMCLDRVEAAMVYEGITLFKGLSVSDVSVLSFDIESDGLVQTKKSTVYLITNTFKKDGVITKKHFRLDHYNNAGEMIDAWCDWVQEIDPDIVNGHNILGYDLPYLAHVAKLNKTLLILGRNDSPIKFKRYDSNYRVDGAQVWKYRKARIFGRNIIDGMFLAVKYDFGRKYPNWGLKPIAEAEGLVKENRQFYDASKINENWHIPEEREKIIAYGIGDSDDSLALYELMINSYFYLTQSIPRSFDFVIESASGSWLNSILCRAYLQKGFSLPKASEHLRVAGGMSYGVPGIYSNVIKWDAKSYYPSTILAFNIKDDDKDPHNYYVRMVRYFTEKRFEQKKQYKETGDSYYDDLQASSKIFINSSYGLLGTSGLNFNNFNNAALITKCCRKGLQKCIKWATGHDTTYWWKEYEEEQDFKDYSFIDKFAKVSYKEMNTSNQILTGIDTDSLAFAKKDNSPYTEEEISVIHKELNNIMYSEWEDDGHFDRFFMVKAKNYAMLSEGKIKIKGSSFIDAKKEPILKEMILEILHGYIKTNDFNYLEVYERYLNYALNITKITPWLVKKSITENLLLADSTTKTKALDAINGTDYRVGDKVYLFNDINGEIQAMAKGEPVVFKKTGEPKMIPNRVLKLGTNFKGSYDKWHYIERVYKTMKIFNTIIDKDKIINYSLKKNRPLLEHI